MRCLLCRLLPFLGEMLLSAESSNDSAVKSIRNVCHSVSMAESAERKMSLELIAAPAIEKRILVVRGRQVMLDEDLADLYGVETRVLVQQVRRNEKRFPADFMFQLSAQEFSDLKSQSVISSGGHGGRRKPPLVFTEHGVAMLSGVLRSERAIAVADRHRASGSRRGAGARAGARAGACRRLMQRLNMAHGPLRLGSAPATHGR